MAIRNALRRRFRAGETSYGLWVSTESPTVTEVAVTLGLDWVCVEMEHGHLDFHDVMNHIRAVRGSETAVVVRLPDIQMSSVKRVLDMGAHGVILPYAQSAAEIERGFQYGRYPPRGIRGIGGDRAVQWGLGTPEYLGYADEETLIIPLIETRGAVEEMDAILAIPGLEAIFFGPADLSASYGYKGQWEGPGMAERILDIRAKAAAQGIAAGIMARSLEDTVLRRDQGFQMIALGTDMNLMIRAIRQNLEAVGRQPALNLWF
jgi:2-dehydro-3-deoxyglucarate aldolase/4-hydroxy-2-oxoheptanedioate aldolase